MQPKSVLAGGFSLAILPRRIWRDSHSRRGPIIKGANPRTEYDISFKVSIDVDGWVCENFWLDCECAEPKLTILMF